MYTTKLITKCFSLFALALFSLSLFMTPPVADISAEEPLTNSFSYPRSNPRTLADYPENYTRVDWDLGTVNEENTHNWNSSHYRFGPTINWHTRNTTDSTLITWEDEIAINEYVNFIVEIPYSSLGGQTPFGVYLMGQYFNMSALANSEGDFQMSGNSPIMFMVWYNISGGNWLTFSSTNTTWPESPPTELPPDFALSDVFGTEVAPFMEMNVGASGYLPKEESYWANVQLRFNSSTIGGFYTVSCGVQDNHLNPLAESRFEEFNSGRIIGTTFDFLVDQAVGGYYDWERVSDDGFPVHSATRGVDFNMTATITNGTTLDNATVLFEIPNQIRTLNWVYGLYTETEEVTGVWEFDNVSETYVWNDARTVNWTSQKEGFHYEEGYTWLDIGKEYNFWNGGSIETRWTRGMAAIVYDFSAGTFTTLLAYHYQNMTWVVDEHGGFWDKIDWFEYEPWPMDGSIPLPYILNLTTSESYWDTGNLVVTFRGHIGDDILPTTSDDGNWPLNVYEIIMDIYGRNLAPKARLPLASPEDAARYDMLRNLAVESPVSIVTLTHGGEPYEPDWMFYNEVGDPFTVKSWLQGGADYIDEIDGVGFFMKAHEEDWGFDGMSDWHQWTDLEVQIRIDPHGAVEVAIYNRTVRNQWVDSTYWDWVMVEVMPGRWEPQWTMMSDFHWEELTWDQVANDWVHGWISDSSPQLRMSVHWLDVAGLMIDLVGNDLRVIFDILPTDQLPQLEWRWQYFYGDLTWVVDYESGWGEHTVLGWNENTVYSYLNGTKLYMEEPIKAEIFRNNQTGDFYQREKVPFVEIGGVEEDLDLYIFTDMETNWEEVVRSEFNYDTGEEEYFIKFANGTEIQIYTGSVAAVYNITLPNLGGAQFQAWGDSPQYTGYSDLYSMMAVNGSMIVLPWFLWDPWFVSFSEVVDVSLVEHTFVTHLNGTKPFYMVGWPEYIGPDHYMMYRNGTYEPVEFFWNPMWGYHYWNMTDGKLYMFEWPWELMTGVYNSQPFFIPHYMTNSRVYTVVNSVEYQLPAPGIPMWNPWELNNLDNIFNPANGRYFANEYAIVDGVPYEATKLPMQEFEPIFGYWYDVWEIDTGVVYNLTDWSVDPVYKLNYDYDSDGMENRPWTTMANGSIWVPEVVQEDWTVAYGHRDTQTYEFVADGWLDLQTGFFDGNYPSSQIYEWNMTGGYDYVLTMGGEKFFYNETWRATFLNISLSNGTFFYSRMDHPSAEPTSIFEPEIDRYFMIDIYGNYQGWQGWMDYTAELVFVENVLGDDPWAGGQFFWNGTYQPVIQYPVDYWEWDGSMWYNITFMEDNIVPHFYYFLQSALNGSMYEIVELHRTPESYKFNFPSWAFNVTGTEYHAFGAKEVLYQAFRTQGYSMKLDYEPLPISIISAQEVIVYGAPSHGMWENDVWTVDPLSGALDLDGNLGTTFDQFYVKEIHTGSDSFNITQQYLDVNILWEPDNGTWADEFSLHSYTGMVTFNWTYDWSETNIWTHTDGTFLTTPEWEFLNSTLFDIYGNPKPGYWGIAWMFENRTYADMLQQAQDEGWDWVESNSQEWSWLWWELDEQYSTEVSNGTHSDLMDISLAYQYAGMFAWNDTNRDNFMDISAASLGDAELTHYWMPIDVESVSFTTPGEGWGNLNSTDSEYRPVNETIDFGVTFNNVTGEVYPFGVRSYFDWYESAYYGSDFVDFDERPTECLTEEFSIDVHFTGVVNETVGAESNSAEVKFDITVGDWEMYTPGGVNVLEDRSLAVAFYSDITILTSGGMTANASYIDDLGQTVTNDQAAASYNFTMASGLSDVALMSLGGAPYTWSKNTSMPVTVDAQTVPLDAFSAIYVSGGGQTATTFSIASTQFFTVIGFPQWDGWAVTVDPIFVGYISTGTSDGEAPTFGTVAATPLDILGTDYCHVEAAVTDTGGSDLKTVKVYDIDQDENHTMTFNEGSGRWEANIERRVDGRYTFNYQIIAEDNAGNVGVSASDVFQFRDNIAPSIDTLNIVNGTGPYGEIATITVQATDTGGSGISTVTLTYSNTSGDFNVPMTFSAGDWTGEIPNHAPGTIVSYYVTVEDVDGNSVQSSPAQFTFYSAGAPDTIGPSVTLVAHTPTSPTPSDTVTVSSDILDISGVGSAVLQYNVDSGAWNNITMTNVGDTYSGSIPAQVDGASVTYRIVAYDGIGNEAVSSEHSYIVAEVTTTPTTTTTTPTGPTSTSPTPPGPGPINEEMLMVYGSFGALVLIVVLLAIKRRK